MTVIYDTRIIKLYQIGYTHIVIGFLWRKYTFVGISETLSGIARLTGGTVLLNSNID